MITESQMTALLAQLEAIREIRMAYEMALKAKAGGL